MRVAKARRSTPEWWRDQFRTIKGANDSTKLLVQFACWTWASVETILAIYDDVAESLETLTPLNWSSLLTFFVHSFSRVYFPPGPASERNQELPDYIASTRLALLIGLKDESRYGRSAFLKFFLESKDAELAVAEFRQSRAFEAAIGGVYDWQLALAIIRSTYAQGAAYRIARLTDTLPRGKTIPDFVMQHVLQEATQYPMYLCECVEGLASVQARRAVKPVAQVARRDRWFSP
jgi:hypothetical protein